MEGEIGVICLETKEHQVLLGNHQKRERSMELFSFGATRKN